MTNIILFCLQQMDVFLLQPTDFGTSRLACDLSMENRPAVILGKLSNFRPSSHPSGLPHKAIQLFRVPCSLFPILRSYTFNLGGKIVATCGSMWCNPPSKMDEQFIAGNIGQPVTNGHLVIQDATSLHPPEKRILLPAPRPSRPSRWGAGGVESSGRMHQFGRMACDGHLVCTGNGMYWQEMYWHVLGLVLLPLYV